MRGVVVLVCALLFIPLCVGLSSRLGNFGAALSVTGALGLGAGTLWTLSQRGPKPVPFQYLRLAGVVGVGVGCYALARIAGALLPGSGIAPDIVGLAAYPLAVVAFGIIPRHHLEPLVAVARAVVSRETDGEDFDRRLGELTEHERSALLSLTRNGRQGREVDMRTATTALVKLARIPSERADDERISHYLFGRLPEAERNAIASRLYDRGVTPDELARLERWHDRVRRNARR